MGRFKEFSEGTVYKDGVELKEINKGRGRSSGLVRGALSMPRPPGGSATPAHPWEWQPCGAGGVEGRRCREG